MKMEPQKFLELLKTNTQGQDKTPPVEIMRADFDSQGKRSPIHDSLRADMTELGGVACLCLAPKTKGKAHILYLHGGGYAGGSPVSHQGVTSALAVATELTLWSVDYRLAPEHPFPAGLEDALAAYQGLIDIAGSADNIIVAGDSAGGGLSVATMLKAKEMGLPMPAGLALLSPWSNLTLDSWSLTHNVERDFLAAPEMLDIMAGWYADAQERAHPLISPCFGDLSGLPPMLIHVGSEEILLSDSVLLTERAAGEKVPVTLKIWPDMPHVFQMFSHFLEAAETSISEISDWMGQQLG